MVKTRNIKQKVVFKNVEPYKVYEILMDSKKHTAFTGSSAKVGRKVGDRVSAYDGWIEAVNLELVPRKKIVQKWRGKDWPKMHFSIASFELAQKGSDTELTFTQTGVPEDKLEDINDGWRTEYWEKMGDFFKKR